MAGTEPKAMPLPIEGSCRCGKTTIKVTQLPLFTAACHCKTCQKMTSGAYSLSVSVPPDSFEVTKGEPVIGGAKDPACVHYHCPDCLSWMFTKLPALPYFVNVRAPMLDGIETWLGVPWVETQTKEKLPWVDLGIPKERSFERWPADGAFPLMVKGYQTEVKKNSGEAEEPAK
jgi:hypothetical protein